MNKGAKEALLCNVKALTMYDEPRWSRFLPRRNQLREQESVQEHLFQGYEDMEIHYEDHKFYRS